MSTYNRAYYELNRDKLSKQARTVYRDRLANDPDYLEKQAKRIWMRKRIKSGLPFNPDEYVYKKREKQIASEIKYLAFNKEFFIEGTMKEILTIVSGLTENTFKKHLANGTEYNGWCFDQVE